MTSAIWYYSHDYSMFYGKGNFPDVNKMTYEIVERLPIFLRQPTSVFLNWDNPMDKGAWHGVTNKSDTTEQLSLHFIRT